MGRLQGQREDGFLVYGIKEQWLPTLGRIIPNKASPILTIFYSDFNLFSWYRNILFSWGKPYVISHMVSFSSALVFPWSQTSPLLMGPSWVSCAGGDSRWPSESSITRGKLESTWTMLHNVKGSSETLHFSSSRWLPVFSHLEFNRCTWAFLDIP